ncbi:MAG: N-acetylmuramoyl-L-alanine amidase [Actinomycetota bacterium]|nr:N-acetylmuramoyl-L-alanine amidase [Actinomycetota bacterium]
MVKRGLTALLLVLSLIFMLALPAYASFSDLSSSDECYNAVVDLTSKNIISGFPDGTYRPFTPLTRAQMAKLICVAKQYPQPTTAAGDAVFNDVPAGHWCTDYIKASSAAGIVRGYTDGTFKPEQQITRAELARMLRRAIEMPVVTTTTANYSDVASGYWAYDEIETVAYYGIMGGANGKFRPTDAATRAEIALAIYNMLNADLTPPEEPPAPEDDGRLIVALDAGHGGKDPGAVAKSNGLKEKDVNLAVALKVRDLLKSAGIEVVMTRETDVFLELSQRATTANNANADVFISIHHNSSVNNALDGTAVYSHPNSQEGARLAKIIQDELVKAFGWAGVKGKDDGIKTADFKVLRETLMPAVLCESAFLSNADEAALLATDEFRQKEAEGIFKGIAKYLGVSI